MHSFAPIDALISSVMWDFFSNFQKKKKRSKTTQNNFFNFVYTTMYEFNARLVKKTELPDRNKLS